MKDRRPAIQKLEKILVALILGVVGSAVVAWYYTKTPRLSVELLNSVNLVDVNEDAKKLEILYDGKSIKGGGGVLKIVTVRIVNDGSAPIRQNDFANDAPFGLAVPGGEIVEAPQLIEASSKYLEEHLRPTRIGTDHLVFKPAVVDAGDFATIKLLILYRGGGSTKTDVEIVGGPIAGVKPVLRTLYQERETSPFWTKVLSGGPLVHLTRLVMYVIGIIAAALSLLILAFFVALPFALFARLAAVGRRRARKRVVDAFMKEPTFRPGAISSRVFQRYLDLGLDRIKQEREVLLAPRDHASCIRNELLDVGALKKTRTDGAKKYRIVTDENARDIYEQFIAFVDGNP
jgi:hypothetical protein